MSLKEIKVRLPKTFENSSYNLINEQNRGYAANVKVN
jgi:hypothetical protein